MEMQQFGKIVVILGLAIVVAGIGLMYFDRIPFLGKLPGDIHIKRDNYQVIIPVTTSILVSVLISLVLWIIFHIRGK